MARVFEAPHSAKQYWKILLRVFSPSQNRWRAIFFKSICTLVFSACGAQDITPPAASYQRQMVTAKSDSESLTLNEGEETDVTVSLDEPLRAGGIVNWKILGSANRFAESDGTISLERGVTSFTIHLKTIVDSVIQNPATVLLQFASANFVEPVSVEIQLNDNSQPAVLGFVEVSPYVFPVTGINSPVSATLTLTNTGEATAGNIHAVSLPSPFRFQGGGAFPGTGGSCLSELESGASCQIGLEFESSSGGVNTENFELGYSNGQSDQVLTISLKGMVDSVIAELADVPSLVSNLKVLNVKVQGSGITDYKMKVGAQSSTDCSDGTGYSAQTSVASRITSDISAVADGAVRLCVVGYNGSTWQQYGAATMYQWIKRTQAPLNPSIAINGGAVATNSLNVVLTLSADNAADAFITNVDGCALGGTWRPITPTASWVLNSANGNNTVYVKYRDDVGNETSCLGAPIKHDSISPTLTLNKAATQESTTLTAPIEFVAEFSEDIDSTSFTASDIEQMGTAQGITWSVAPDGASQSRFLVKALSVDVGGTITPKISAGKVMDPAGNLNAASTSTDSTVLFNVVEFYISQLTAGYDHSCALSTDGKAYCWGSDNGGRLGVGGAAGGKSKKPSLVNTASLGAGFKGFRKLSAGGNVTCGLSNEGKIYCWGNKANDQLGAGDTSLSVPNQSKPNQINYPEPTPVPTPKPDDSPVYSDVAVGGDHVCAIESAYAYLYCWGKKDHGQPGSGADTISYPYRPYRIAPWNHYTNVTGGSRHPKSLAAGMSHTCALFADGKVYCWGLGTSGQIGNGASVNATVLTAVTEPGGFLGFTQVAAGGNASCAVHADGKVYCWGLNNHGQLGDGTTTNSNIPVEVDTSGIIGFTGFTTVAVGAEHTCGRSADGYVYCWGSYSDGRLGSVQTADQLTPRLVELAAGTPLANVSSVSVGRDHSCATRLDGRSFCWGKQTANGELGNNSETSSSFAVPVDVDGLLGRRSFTQIAAGNEHTCAVTSQGKIMCWGEGSSGELGNGLQEKKSQPTNIDVTTLPPGTLFQQVSSGDRSSCGLSGDGKVYCWGYNADGKLGAGAGVATGATATRPIAIDTSGITSFSAFKKISVGANQACALHSDGEAYCWGKGLNGQLGRGSTTSTNKPDRVHSEAPIGLGRFIDIAAGGSHVCGVSGTGLPFCWGYGALGRLGNGLILDKTEPIAVKTNSFPAQSRVVSITAGSEHSCAVVSGDDTPASTRPATMKNQAYCWGYNDPGRLGDGSTTPRTEPVALSVANNATGWVSFSAGAKHTCGTDARGANFCFGENLLFQVGDGNSLSRVSPTAVDFSQILDFKFISGIVAGGGQSCAVGSNGDSYCWGDGRKGQVGNGQMDLVARPVKVGSP